MRPRRIFYKNIRCKTFSCQKSIIFANSNNRIVQFRLKTPIYLKHDEAKIYA
jgi:hypothetical protein